MIFSWSRLTTVLAALVIVGCLLYPSQYFQGLMHRQDPNRGVSIAFFKTYLREHPYHRGASLALARAYEGLAEPENSAKVMEELYSHRRGDAHIAREYIALLERAGDFEGADAVRWRTYEDLRGRPETDRLALEQMLYASYQSAVVRQDDEGQRRLLKALIEISKRPQPYRWQLLNLHRARGDFSRAIAMVRQGLVRNPKDTELQADLAELYLAYERMPEALKSADEALRLSPDSLELLELRVSILERMKRWNETLPALRRMTARRPQRAAWSRRLAYNSMLSGDLPGAADLYARHLERHPEDRKSWMEIAYAYSERGMPSEAARWLERYLDGHPDDAEAVDLLAAAYGRARRPEAHAAVLAAYVRRHPDDAQRARALAELWLERGHLQEAAPLYVRLIDRDPKDKELWWALIYGYADKSMNAEAARVLECYLLSFPRDSKAVSHLAQVRLRQGDKKAAIRMLKEYFSKGPAPGSLPAGCPGGRLVPSPGG